MEKKYVANAQPMRQYVAPGKFLRKTNYDIFLRLPPSAATWQLS